MDKATHIFVAIFASVIVFMTVPTKKWNEWNVGTVLQSSKPREAISINNLDSVSNTEQVIVAPILKLEQSIYKGHFSFCTTQCWWKGEILDFLKIPVSVQDI